MTLREVVASSFNRTVQEPDQRTIENNINSLNDIKKDLSGDKKKELEAIAAELKAHQQAAAQKDILQKQKQTQEQLSKPQQQEGTKAQNGNNPNPLEDTSQLGAIQQTAQMK